MKSLSRSFLKGCQTKHNLGLGLKLASFLSLLLPLAAGADWVGDARPMMGTEVSVYLWSDDPAAADDALEAVFQEAHRIDRLMSTYKDKSEISKINRIAADAPVLVGAELYQLIDRSPSPKNLLPIIRKFKYLRIRIIWAITKTGIGLHRWQAGNT